MTPTSRIEKRVLIVNPDAQFLRAIEIALSEHGYDAIALRNSSEAFTAAKDVRPPLLVADVAMPGRIGGLELAESLRARIPHLQCVLIGDRHRSTEPMGADDADWLQVVRRPFSMMQFIAISERSLRRAKASAKRTATQTPSSRRASS